MGEKEVDEGVVEGWLFYEVGLIDFDIWLDWNHARTSIHVCHDSATLNP